jgi:hypothetical protein
MPYRDQERGKGYRNSPRKEGVTEDVFRSGLSGVAKSLAALIGAPGDIVQTGGDFLEKTGVKGASEAAKRWRMNPSGPFGAPLPGQGARLPVLTGGEARGIVPTATREPKTLPGKYADTVGQFATSALNPGRAISKTASVVIPGLASEGAGQLTKGTKYEKAARLAAALGGGAATGLGGAGAAPGEARIIANATRSVTPQQMRLAQALRQEGERRGVPLTLAEALEKVTGSGTGMGGVQRSIEGTPQGQKVLGPMMAQRPAGARKAATQAIDKVAKPSDPIRTGLRGQKAAEKALRQEEQARSAAVNPSYKAAGPKTVDPAAMDQLLSDIRAQAAADKTGLIGPKLLEFANRIKPEGANRPILDVENLDRIRKYYRDKGDLPPGSADALDKEQAAALGSYLERLANESGTGLLDQVPEFAAGKQQYQQLSQDVVDPAMVGPLGSMRKTPNAGTQAGALYPPKPLEGQPQVTADTLKALGSQDAAIPADLTRAHLAQALAEQTQDLVSGPNQWGGANFAANVAGNPIQEQTLMSGLGQVGADPNDMRQLLEVLRATGTRQRPGSPTAQNLAMAEDLKANTSALGNVASGANMPKVFDRVQRAVERWDAERNAEQLANTLISPADQTERLMQRIHGQAPEGELQRRLLLQALLGGRGFQVQGQANE